MKMLLKLAMLCLLPNMCFGQWFNLKVSLLNSYSFSRNSLSIMDGKFLINTRDVNIGAEVINLFTLNKNYKLGIGLRYLPFSTDVSALNQMKELYNQPSPFIWKRKFGTISMPFYIIREIKLKNDRVISLYIDASLGLIFGNTIKNIGRSSGVKYMSNTDNTDTFKYEMWGTGEFIKPQLIYNIGLGGEIEPFKRFQGFKIGVYAVFQANKVSIGDYHAKVTNISKDRSFSYNMSALLRYYNIGVSLSYNIKHRN